MRPRAGRGSLNTPNTRSRYVKRKKGRSGLLLVPVLLVILVIVFFAGRFLMARIGDAIMEAAIQVADLPVMGGGDENAAVWKSKERVNVLLLGTDQRDDEKGQPTRTDVMQVLSIDPANKTAAMIGIPRDLWVRIPLLGGQFVDAKINTANFYGDYYKYPGGGLALAKKTAENLLGIKVHYVARLNFTPFQRVVDAVGGVNVDVPKPLKDDEYPTPDYGVVRIFIPAGLQHLDGERALQYVRSRHQDSDFGRLVRQQQVLVALRDSAVNLGTIAKLPGLVGEFKDMIDSDLAPAEALALAKVAGEVDSTNVNTVTIDPTCCVSPIITFDGEDALLPNEAAIKKLVSDTLSPMQAPPSAATKP
ncbi:MAG: LCP family protein [Dehalococcoidia bacterium]|nr:LCP family protein [Dehalococcoidia bacterium]